MPKKSPKKKTAPKKRPPPKKGKAPARTSTKKSRRRPPVLERETLSTRDDMGGTFVLEMPEAPPSSTVRRFSKPKKGEERYSTRLAIKATPQELTAWHRAAGHLGRSTSALVRQYLATVVERVTASIARGEPPASRRTMELPYMERAIPAVPS